MLLLLLLLPALLPLPQFRRHVPRRQKPPPSARTHIFNVYMPPLFCMLSLFPVLRFSMYACSGEKITLLPAATTFFTDSSALLTSQTCAVRIFCVPSEVSALNSFCPRLGILTPLATSYSTPFLMLSFPSFPRTAASLR